MVTATEQPRVKKVRVTRPDGKFQWITPVETPPIPAVSARGDAMRELAAGPLLDWNGNEVEEWEEGYNDYLNSMPSREDLRPYREPACYWEVRYPGVALMPYPRMGAFTSLDTGLWETQNKAQEDAVREHIRQNAQVDPDLMRLSGNDLDVMNGRVVGPIRFCQDCHAVYSSLFASNLHESLTGHRTDQKPRTDTRS